MTITSDDIILATALHFMQPRDTWDKPTKRKKALAIRRIAAAVVIREGASAEQAATALNCVPQTIHDMARDCEILQRYLMHIVDIQARLRKSEAA